MTQPTAVAIAILYRQGAFLMQLRDDIHGIAYPGCWGFFGGHMEPGETPEVGVKRELMEEIEYVPPVLSPFGVYPSDQVIRHIFHGPLTVDINALALNEGWDLGLLTPADIQRGNCYSAKAEQVRALGAPHQKILLDFLDQNIVGIDIA